MSELITLLFLACIFPTTVVAQNPIQNHLPINNFKPYEEIQAIVYAYNSEVAQTDNNPFTTASGVKVRNGIIANNCLSFGTPVEIDGKVYEVLDRMNGRYTKCGKDDVWYFDIWMLEKRDSTIWGIQEKLIKIYY